MGWMRGSGLTYTRVWGTPFDEIVVRELAWPPVISLTAALSPTPILQTENVPLFQNRYTEFTTVNAAFSTSDTGADVVRFFPVAGGQTPGDSVAESIAIAGRQRMHVSGVTFKKITAVATTNDVYVRWRYNDSENPPTDDWATDIDATPELGLLIKSGETVSIVSKTPCHRMYFQAIANTSVSNGTVRLLYWGTNQPSGI